MASVPALATAAVGRGPAPDATVFPGGPIRGVLFDLDGTLYRQAPLRALMALELCTLPLTNPLTGWRQLRVVSEYRRAQEVLRERGTATGQDAQCQLAATAAGVTAVEARRVVDEWMVRRPLKYLRRLRAAGLDRTFDWLASRGVPVGVLTDYPALDKLRALGLRDRFSTVLCATDPEIGSFKPHPRGFLLACERWGLEPRQVLMVGDRVEVDAAGAAAAGMPSVIIGRRQSAPLPPNCLLLPSFERLHDVLVRCCA